MIELDLSHILGKHVTGPILICLLWQLFKELSQTKNPKVTNTANDQKAESSSSSSIENAKMWKPVKLMNEQVIPIEEEDKENYKSWEETPPYPYKPFSPGKHTLKMDVSTIPMSYWIVMDKSYKEHISRKWKILETDYEDVVFHLDPAMINAKSEDTTTWEGKMITETIVTEEDIRHADKALCELYENMVSYLVCRFPQHFQIVVEPGATPGALYNAILGEYHPIDANRYLELPSEGRSCINYECFNSGIIPEELTQNLDAPKDNLGYRVLISCDKTRRAHELILAMSRLVEDDLILLSGNSATQYNGEMILYSGIFAFASGFNPRNKFLKPLTQIHRPVPGYKSHLQSPMNRFFSRLKPNKLAYRVNYAFQNHPKMYYQNRTAKPGNQAAIESKGNDEIYYRSERQTVMKLETSEGKSTLVFGLKTYLLNFKEEILTNDFYNQPHILEELRQAIMGIDGAFGEYKGKKRWGSPLMEIIEQYQRAHNIY